MSWLAEAARLEKYDPLTACYHLTHSSELHVFPSPLLFSFLLFSSLLFSSLLSSPLLSSFLIAQWAISRRVPQYEPGPAQAFFLLKREIFPHCCLFGGQILGFCKAPKENLDCNRRYINKKKWKYYIARFTAPILPHTGFDPPKMMLRWTN